MAVVIAREPLTDRQREVLEFIKGYLVDNGFAPTLRETAAYFGFSSVTGVLCHIAPLIRKGYIHRVKIGNIHTRYMPVVPDGHCPCCARRL